jgi:hypothetical protein
MDYKYLRLIPLISAISLGGCELTDDDREKLDKAGENLEKVALAPAITSPGENANIFDATVIRIGTDTTVPHASVTLLIDGQEIATDTEAPFEFNWDPYFWSKDKQGNLSEEEQIAAQVATISVTALTEGEAFLRSGVRNIKLSETLKDSISFTAPASNQDFQNTNKINLAWTSRAGAVSYEYQLNDEQAVSTANTNASLTLEETGSYQLKVRATNSLGFTGAWSTPSTFNINIPNAPTMNTPIASKSGNDWQASFSWSGALVSSELQIATDQVFNSVVDTLPTNDLTITESLPAGVYFARVRTTNEFDHVSDWSAVREISVGLFAHKIDMATTNIWGNEDIPIEFVLNDNDAVILASRSNNDDSSGDDFYVSKVDFDGKTIRGNSYLNYAYSPSAISKSENGYLLVGAAKSGWSDRTIFEINEAGAKLWQQDITHNLDIEGSTKTSERIDGAVQLSDSMYAFINTTYNYTITGPINDWGNYPTTLDNKEFKVSILDRSTEPTQITSHIIINPGNGSYDYLNKLLLTDSGLYTAGRYTASNDTGPDNSADSYTPTASDSGAFLVTMDKTDGSITSYKTGGGIGDSNVSNLIELTNGDITVSYNNYYTGATTTFASNADSSISKLDNAIGYSKIAPDQDGGYFMVGTSKTNDKKSIIARYNAENQRIGLPHTFNSCFYDLDIAAIKYHPDYGLIALGTDGYNYSSKYTVLFNITDDFDYLCPTTKN